VTLTVPPTRVWVGVVLAAALALGVFGLHARTVYAHAAYDRSEPGFAAELPDAPDRVDIWFSQELFRQEGANAITVSDDAGALWLAAELTLDRDDRRHVFAELPERLPAGRYFVGWTNLSADDGDDEAGRFVFYVSRAATHAEIDEDRALAADLLIPYPGDETIGAGSAAPPPPQAVVIDDATSDAGISGVVIALGAVSALVVVGLTLTGVRGPTSRPDAESTEDR
jgi:methionine-rich copper-binding protein CopC